MDFVAEVVFPQRQERQLHIIRVIFDQQNLYCIMHHAILVYYWPLAIRN
jgi:hypothetical protein